jgi:hypothetical protein
MRIFFTQLFVLLFISAFYSQTRKHSFVFQKQATVNFNAIKTDYKPKMMVQEMPKEADEKVEYYNYSSKSKSPVSQCNTILPPLYKSQSFQGQAWGLSTPNDNDFAISDSGLCISVANTNMFIRDVNTGYTNLKSLAAFTSSVNSNHQEFDPRVMYDPQSDRFVVACLVGFVDTTSKIIVGFSQTNDPFGNWNLYTLPGNPLNDTLWSDYPMIAMTNDELFLTVNLLVNNQPWQTGFVQTVIWQMKKNKGYSGQPLGALLHSNIKYNGRPIRNLCPVKGGSQLYGPNMYFLSNRNLASQNDTVFLVNLTDTIGAPSQTITTKAIITPQMYFMPPDARQTNTVQTLATNDCRNLGAFLENNKIQYVHNTANPSNSLCSVYYGVMDSPQSPTPTINAWILQNDTTDFGYPNISYAGNSGSDNTSIITFDHSSDKIFAGCSGMRTDANGNFSPLLRIQDGLTYVNLLAGNQERWGDYSGSQRRYNNPGEVWMSGYNGYPYSGSYPYAHRTWIAQLALSNAVITGVKANEPVAQNPAAVFPNPSKDYFNVELGLSKPEYLNIELFDGRGRLVTTLMRDWVKALENVFSFSTHDLPKGIYVLKISGNYGTNITKKVVVE